MKKMLIAYYSWSNGNTKRIAEMLQERTDADIVRIDTVEPYKGSCNDVVNQGQEEVNNGYKPPIQKLSVCPDDYDVIAIGTPTWWYTMAPAVRTFIEECDFKGKTVIPFMTNGGWAGHVIKDMADACKRAKICHEMEVKFSSDGGDTLETPQNVICQWIDGIVGFLAQERK
ncbi:MAG: NAD(P)H-dependent oxidoreductase [Lachnospiraceae bacterium]|nr:NAD(P)H-dependent oxidoreductase [Lachnospiraceae bacterium]